MLKKCCLHVGKEHHFFFCILLLLRFRLPSSSSFLRLLSFVAKVALCGLVVMGLSSGAPIKQKLFSGVFFVFFFVNFRTRHQNGVGCLLVLERLSFVAPHVASDLPLLTFLRCPGIGFPNFNLLLTWMKGKRPNVDTKLSFVSLSHTCLY